MIHDAFTAETLQRPIRFPNGPPVTDGTNASRVSRGLGEGARREADGIFRSIRDQQEALFPLGRIHFLERHGIAGVGVRHSQLKTMGQVQLTLCL